MPIKKKLLTFSSIAIAFCFSFNLFAQTDGTLTFSFTQPVPTSPSGTKNVLAVWIENSSGTFIKTKMRYWGGGTNDHLPTWLSKSAQNITDASTGATRTTSTTPTAFGTKTFTWDGKNVNGSVNGTTVPDGTYKVWIESSWQNSLTANAHNAITSFTFTKGPAAESLTPTGDTYFNAITIDWVPATTSVENISENPFIVAYPNPTTGILNLDYYKATHIQILNILGSVIYSEATNELSGFKSIDLRNLPNGIYFINLINGEKSTKYKIILNK